MTNETKELKTYTMQELYKQPLEPVEYLVDGLLAPGLYILGGSPKVGKSWMALQLCLAVCGGGAFLGRATRKSEVLYLALEDGPQRLHSRALRLADTAPEGLHLCHRAAPIGQGLEQQIEAQLAEYRNSAGGAGYAAKGAIRGRQWADLRQRLRGRRDTQGAGRSQRNLPVGDPPSAQMADDDPFNRLSGTNGLTGAADGTLILMRNKRQDGTATLYATGRDIEDVEEELEFADCRWSRAVPQEQLATGFGGECAEKAAGGGGVPGNSHRAGSATGKAGQLLEPGDPLQISAKPR